MAQYSPVLKSSLPRLKHGSHVVRGFRNLIVGFCLIIAVIFLIRSDLKVKSENVTNLHPSFLF